MDTERDEEHRTRDTERNKEGKIRDMERNRKQGKEYTTRNNVRGKGYIIERNKGHGKKKRKGLRKTTIEEWIGKRVNIERGGK